MGAPSNRYKIFVYGLEKKGLVLPLSQISSRQYALEFFPRHGTPRFQDADGVILFQGSFESFQRKNDHYKSYLKHEWDRDELDRRTKETLALTQKGGFVCLLLSEPFIDIDEGRDFRQTDLSKRLLSGIVKESFGTRFPLVISKVTELERFFTLYGAAWTSFQDFASKTLAIAGNRNSVVSIVSDGTKFILPTLLPRAENFEEYFTILADGVVTLWERMKEELPDWVKAYQFWDEGVLTESRRKLTNEVLAIDKRLKKHERRKRVLVLQGEPLVDAVMELFEDALPLKPKREEAFREDVTLANSEGNPVAVVEVKGVSRGVTREHVNQADSHRERNGLPASFPSLLIINTALRSSSSMADKDQDVATEQVQHAARNNVLIIRTLDLLNLASLHLSGKIVSETVVELLTKSRGWLKVGDAAEVRTT